MSSKNCSSRRLSREAEEILHVLDAVLYKDNQNSPEDTEQNEITSILVLPDNPQSYIPPPTVNTHIRGLSSPIREEPYLSPQATHTHGRGVSSPILEEPYLSPQPVHTYGRGVTSPILKEPCTDYSSRNDYNSYFKPRGELNSNFNARRNLNTNFNARSDLNSNYNAKTDLNTNTNSKSKKSSSSSSTSVSSSSVSSSSGTTSTSASTPKNAKSSGDSKSGSGSASESSVTCTTAVSSVIKSAFSSNVSSTFKSKPTTNTPIVTPTPKAMEKARQEDRDGADGSDADADAKPLVDTESECYHGPNSFVRRICDYICGRPKTCTNCKVAPLSNQPKSYMVLAVITALFVNPFFGIPAVLYANKADSSYKRDQNYHAAQFYGQMALWLSITGIVLSSILTIASLIFVFIILPYEFYYKHVIIY